MNASIDNFVGLYDGVLGNAMALPRQSVVSRQPCKAVYSLLALTITMLKLPLYLVYYSLPSLRQHPQWTYKQALMNTLLKTFLYHAAVVEMHTPLPLSSNEEENGLVRMKPPSAETFRGSAQDPEIDPSTVAGTWYPKVYKAGDELRHNIILHFHGGAYAICEGSEGDSGYAANLLVAYAGAKVLFPSYRLSSNQGGRFPASLQDAITSYKYLLDLGIPATRITLSGDSAGANLALGLLRYMTEHQDVLSSPSSLLLWSPTTDVEAAQDPRTMDHSRHADTDLLPGNFCAWGALRLIADAPSAAVPYFSPRKHPFLTSVPMWVQIGGLEILYDSAIEFVENTRVKGNSVDLHVEPYANHDILYLGNSTGFNTEAIKAATAAGKFLNDRRDK